MGLDTSHDAWHGPYSSFMEWRKWLANQIGFNLNEMDGFGGSKPFEQMKHNIRPLLDHSDCDGELSPDECRQIAFGLQQILDALPADEPSEAWSNKWLTERFMKGCLRAAVANESIDFH